MTTHAYGNFVEDTLHSDFYFTACSTDDSTIYLFTNKTTGLNSCQHQVFYLHPAGLLEEIASNVETTPSGTFGYTFIPRQNGIYELYHKYQDVYARQYNLQMQPSDVADSATCVDNYDFGEPLLMQMQGTDSVFVCYYMYDFANDMEAWILIWLTPGLQEITRMEYVLSTSNYPYYGLNFRDVVKVDGRIYLLTYKVNDMNGPAERWMDVYDDDFQLTCQYSTGADENDHLTVLNGEAYIIRENTNEVALYRVDECGIAGLSDQESSSFGLFPNPSSGTVTMNTIDDRSGDTLTIHTAGGQLVMQVTLENAFQNSMYLNLAPGVYLVSIGGTAKKLVIL